VARVPLGLFAVSIRHSDVTQVPLTLINAVLPPPMRNVLRPVILVIAELVLELVWIVILNKGK
jgi:hypothetical protein